MQGVLGAVGGVEDEGDLGAYDVPPGSDRTDPKVNSRPAGK